MSRRIKMQKGLEDKQTVINKVEIEYDVKDVTLKSKESKTVNTELYLGYTVREYYVVGYKSEYNYKKVSNKNELDYKSIGLPKHNQYSIVLSGLSELIDKVLPKYTEYGVGIEVRHQNGTIYKWLSEGITKKNKYKGIITKINRGINQNLKEMSKTGKGVKLEYKVIEKKENETTKKLNKTIKDITKDRGLEVLSSSKGKGVVGKEEGVLREVKGSGIKSRKTRVSLKEVKTKRVVKNDKLKVRKLKTKEINMELGNGIKIDEILD